MAVIPDHFKIAFAPVAAAEAVVTGPQVRFTVLTSRLIRLEYDPGSRFEDRATQTVWYRHHTVPEFTATTQDDQIEIETEHLHLRYAGSGDGFSPVALSIELKESGVVWRYDDVDTGNLRGTYRTLDEIDGYAPLESGLVSRDGWTLVDDSGSLVFNADCWLEVRDAHPDAQDLYFLGYGHDYAACLDDYCRIAGQVPMIPRWVLGNWWSRYWAYSQGELSALMDDFEAYQIPLSVCIVDMDWHITDTGNESSGWTGYSWNRDLFPNPEQFMQFLRDKGLRTALNLHPADGVHPHEAMYADMAERLGIDPDTQEPVRFRIGDPAFANAYFEILHHPQEAIGVNFWWIDWQQGHQSDLAGLDPLFWLNHLHFYDLARDGSNRAFIFSRWGGLGSHRYPVGFSGDTQITWDSLAFQPYFTATSANVCYGWWSHDIGGHYGGIDEPELYTRWVQYGVFSPIFRLHTTTGQFYERRPWGWNDAEVLRVTREAMQLRHALIPYLYSLAWQYHTTSVPFIRPMYYDYPKQVEAYACPQQYTFGDDLIAAPFTEPRDPDTRLSRQVVWLPAGDWFNVFTGEYYTGDAWYAVYGALEDIPVFARSGAIIPMGPNVRWGGVETPTELTIHLFAGADGHFTLYEDDSDSNRYTQGAYGLTGLTQTWKGNALEFTIAPASGDTTHIPARRLVRLIVHGIQAPEQIGLRIGNEDRACPSTYDPATETLTLDPVEMPRDDGLTLAITGPQAGLSARRDRLAETLNAMLKTFRLQSGVKHALGRRIAELIVDPAIVADYAFELSESQQRALFEQLTGAGMHRVRNTSTAELIVLWNNHANDQITCYTNHAYGDGRYFFGGRVDPEAGPVPKFKTFIPDQKLTRRGYLGEHRSLEKWIVWVRYLNAFTTIYQKD